MEYIVQPNKLFMTCGANSDCETMGCCGGQDTCIECYAADLP